MVQSEIVSLETKSSLVTRDIDLFQKITANHSAIIKLSITAADDDLARQIEPHASSSSARFGALKDLSDASLFCGVLMMPILPYINDTEENIRAIVEKAYESGTRFIYPSFGVTMRDRQRDYFFEKAAAIDPSIPARYRERFGDRYSCNSPSARALRTLFAKLCDERGILYKMPDIIVAYKKAEPTIHQPSLF